MKTIILLSLLLGSFLPAWAQGPYKSLKGCHNDTLQYALYNFDQNKQRYTGQKMEMFFKELEFPIMFFFPTDNLPNNPPKSYIDGIIIQADSEDLWGRKSYRHQKRFLINISFEPPYKEKAKPLFQMLREENYEWGPKYYDLFKDYIICSMDVYVEE